MLFEKKTKDKIEKISAIKFIENSNSKVNKKKQ